MINKDLKVSKSIEIQANAEMVWEVLTNPEHIKVYLFGTETITDWQVGSPIIFEGEFQGNPYKDKGNVIENVTNQRLTYNYWSGFSGLEDIEENYGLVTYEIQDLGDSKVKFTWSQIGFASVEGCEHTENSLQGMLEQIKQLAES